MSWSVQCDAHAIHIQYMLKVLKGTISHGEHISKRYHNQENVLSVFLKVNQACGKLKHWIIEIEDLT